MARNERFLARFITGSRSVKSGIIVYFYGEMGEDLKQNKSMCFNEYNRVYTAEEICFNLAKSLEIATLAYPLFALCKKDVDKFQWLHPKEEIKCTDTAKHFWFRIRFIPSKSGLTTLKNDIYKKALSYLFYQMRDDFISNRIVFNKDINDDDAFSKSLGLAVIDKVIYSKEKGMTYPDLVKFKSHHFIPEKYRTKFDGLLGSMKLENSFKPIVEEEYTRYRGRGDSHVKGIYIEALMSYRCNYGAEEFKFNSGLDEEMQAIVQPYDQNHPGLKLVHVNDAERKGFYHSRIEDLMDVSINERGSEHVIHINRKQGLPFTLKSDDYDRALSFVSLLDGYFRLMVDYTHSLCSLVEMHFVADLKALKCHGPVGKSWSKQRLLDRHRADPRRNYLIKLSQERLGNYTLVYLGAKAGHEQFCKIVLDRSTGRYSIPGSDELFPPAAGESKLVDFDSVQSLLDHHRQPPPDGFGLNGIVLPSSPFDPCIYLCNNVKSHEEQNGLVGEQKSSGVSVISSIQLNQKIGEGQYTEVYKSHYMSQDVAVKKLKPRHATNELVNFCNLIHRSSFLGPSSTLVSVLAVCLSHPVSMVMEYAPHGDLGSFLREKKKFLSEVQVHSAAEQTAQALYHLQEVIHEVHGNVRCRNVLVFRYVEGKVLLVKLADPGVLPFVGGGPNESIPWLAPECRGTMNVMHTMESDRYAYGTTLWEMYSFGQMPVGIENPRPALCPMEIYSIMEQCWNPIPDARISIKDIVRDIRQHINKDGGIYNEYADPTIKKEPRKFRVSMASMNGGAVANACQLDSCDSETPLFRPSSSSFNHSEEDSNLSDFTDNTIVDMSSGEFGFINGLSYGGDILRHQLKVNFSDRPLGQGHYGEVYKGEFTGDDGKVISVAIKCLKKSMYYKYSKEFEREFKIMESLKHKYIVRVIGRCVEVFEESPQVLVLEYVENGCLRDFLKKSKESLSQRRLLDFGHEIAQGMLYLASVKIVHRDLAARNVLVTHSLTMKIADFGLSRALSPERNYYKSDGNKELPAPWCAPESLLQQQFTEKTDVWSYGVTFWEILSYGASPQFCEVKDLILNLHSGRRLPKPKDCHPEVFDFIIKHCWAYLPEERTDFCMIEKDYQKLLALVPAAAANANAVASLSAPR